MSFMTKIKGSFSRDDVVPGMAYFRNTGPAGTFCKDCEFLYEIKTKKNPLYRCSRYRSMTGHD
jgi:hypothetical protein